jgi:hypothetical protein
MLTYPYPDWDRTFEQKSSLFKNFKGGFLKYKSINSRNKSKTVIKPFGTLRQGPDFDKGCSSADPKQSFGDNS